MESVFLQPLCLVLALTTTTISMGFLTCYMHPLTEYYLSTIHAIIATIYASIAYCSLSDINEISYTFIIFSHITLGYFFVDLFNIASKGIKKNFEFVAHHILFSLIIIWMVYGKIYHMFGAAVITTEVSTIFLNQYHFLTYYGKNNEMLYKFKNLQIILLTLVFFLSRIMFLTSLVITHSETILNDQILVLAAIFSIGINYFWFYKLIKKIILIIKVKYVNNDSKTE